MKDLVLHPEARAELDAAVAWYERHRPGLGGRFLDEVEKAFARIRGNPKQFPLFRKTGHRKHVLRRFPYVLFYLDLPDRIRITAVAHARRRPGYWRDRTADGP